jgi:hypothetical protein
VPFCEFGDKVYVTRALLDRDWSVEDLEKEIIQSGIAFAQRINREVVKALLASSDKAPTSGMKLDFALARFGDHLSGRGFSPDRFLFPKSCHQRMALQGIIASDSEIQDKHYAGRTGGGLYAFWSTELPKDTALVFDSNANMTITIDPIVKAWPFDSREHNAVGVNGEIKLNVIVKNKQSVIAMVMAV